MLRLVEYELWKLPITVTCELLDCALIAASKLIFDTIPCLGPLVYLSPQTFKLSGYPIF